MWGYGPSPGSFSDIPSAQNEDEKKPATPEGMGGQNETP
jgi:hypothetical protein